MSRHRPQHGADSAEAYVLREYRVVMEDDLLRFDVTIPKALGPRDASNQARERWPDAVVLEAKEVVPESATFDGWLDWAGMKR